MASVIACLLEEALDLFAFGIVNTRNRAVEVIAEILYRMTEPVLRPIRRVLPKMGGIDLSPIVLILLLGLSLRLVLEPIGFSTAVVPWGTIAAFLALSAVAGILAAWLPARRASKLGVLEALRK